MDNVILYKELRETAVTLRTEGQAVRDAAEEADRIMRLLDGSSESEALSELAARFHLFRSGSMENCMSLLSRLANFLEDAAQHYAKTDSGMKMNVEDTLGNKAAFLE